MQQVMFNHYVNVFGKYLFIPQKVLHVVLQSKREKCMHFLGEIKEMSKTKKLPSINKIALELLHHKLGHGSIRSLLAGDTANFWEDIQLRIDPEFFCTSCQISSMNKKAGYKITLNPRVPFKWVFMDIISSKAPKHLTSDTTFLIIF